MHSNRILPCNCWSSISFSPPNHSSTANAAYDIPAHFTPFRRKYAVVAWLQVPNRTCTLLAIAVNHAELGNDKPLCALTENDKLGWVCPLSNRGTTSKIAPLYFLPKSYRRVTRCTNASHAYRLSFQPFQSIFTRTVPARSRAPLPLSQSEHCTCLRYGVFRNNEKKKNYLSLFSWLQRVLPTLH